MLLAISAVEGQLPVDGRVGQHRPGQVRIRPPGHAERDDACAHRFGRRGRFLSLVLNAQVAVSSHPYSERTFPAAPAFLPPSSIKGTPG